ncbi:MAG: hypothetical protein ACO1SV_25860 [Fimbriimonas sp.]
MKHTILKLVTLGVIATAVALPAVSTAQTRSQLQRRQQQKNQWRNLGYAAGAVGIYGALKKDRNLTLLGAAGALYSAHRYEQDRKSQRRLQDSANWRNYRFGSGNNYRYQRLRSSTVNGRRTNWGYSPGRRGKGNAYGHYKNGKAYGLHPSSKRRWR